jgi:hypothetical protein
MKYIKFTHLFSLILMALTFSLISAREYHVSIKGNDKNNGSDTKPFRTISFASKQANPGDKIIVHEGIYRERVTPSRGGISDAERIVYHAAEGEKIEIKGSEVMNGWQKFKNDVWKITIPNAFFGDYNPYKDILTGDWYNDHGRIHHTGEVYLNGKSFYEINTLEGVLNPKPIEIIGVQEGLTYAWYCESDENNTYIYANFHNYNPNKERVEINVRESCFYPDKPGINYITISGFFMSQAATQWAPPTAEQIGLIGTHWSKGWIIENNVISDSKCTGITLGKDRSTGHNVWSNNKCKDGATHYNEVIFRALNNGWSKEKLGSHIVRNNTIFNCEQAGICGSLDAVFSEITNNHIYNIWTKRLFSGAEIGGIKIHASIDMIIKNNHIHNTGRGIWIDWMAQGTRITANLLYNNTTDDLFSEVNHGPYLVDNNIFLSEIAMRDWSEGGAFVHNLIAGKILVRPVLARFTPYHMPHSTEVAGLRNILGGDNRYYNNIFVKDNTEISNKISVGRGVISGDGLKVYEQMEYPMLFDGNIYYNGAEPHFLEPNYIKQTEFDPKIIINKDENNIYLNITLEQSLITLNTPLVTTSLLDKTKVSDLAFENTDGSLLKIDGDYFGNKRDETNPTAGPFENPGEGELKLKVW